MSFGSEVLILEPGKLKLCYSTKRNINKMSTNLHCGEAASQSQNPEKQDVEK